MIINSQIMVSDLIMTTTTTTSAKQEPSDEDEMKPVFTTDTLQIHNHHPLQHHLNNQQTNEDCNNNLNNMSNRNIKIESKTMFTNNKDYNFQDQQQHKQQQPHSIGTTRCTGCHNLIEDKYVFNLMNTYWHEECLQCCQCRASLKKTCFFKNGLIYCKDDYFKQFGTRCNACYELIVSNELIMRFLVNNPNDKHHQQPQQLLSYHLNCFKCIACERLLQKGDEFVLKNEGIYCKHDYEHTSFQASHLNLLNRLNSSKPPQPSTYSSSTTTTTTSSSNTQFTPTHDDSSLIETSQQQFKKQTTPRKSNSSRRITKRPRTILNAVQRYDFREAFKQSPKPCRKVREHLASKTGLSVRVVQVWFQNERAKMKKMQRRQQQNLLNHKMNKKTSNKSVNNKSGKKVKRGKTIDSDSIISEENSLAGEDDDYGDEVEDDDESGDDISDDEEFDDSDEELDDEDDDDEISKLNRLNPNLSNNNTSSSSSSTTSSLSEFNNSFMLQQQQQQNCYQPQLTTQQQQQQQQQHLFFQQHHSQLVNTPIDRLYSMQNAYFV